MSAIARNRMKNWEIIADNLSKAGWSGVVSQRLIPTANIWNADAHCDDGKRLVVRADEKNTTCSPHRGRTLRSGFKRR